MSETVKKFREQYSPHTGGPHYELFIKATNWAKGLADEYDDQIKGWLSELEKLRRKLREAACFDLSQDLAMFAQVGGVTEHAISEVTKRRIQEFATGIW